METFYYYGTLINSTPIFAIFLIITITGKVFRLGGRKIHHLLVVDYTFNDDSSGSSLLEIKGKRIGFTEWFLEKIGLNNRNFVMQFRTDEIITIDRDKNYQISSIRDAHSIFTGFSIKKSLLVFSIICMLSALFSLIISISDEQEEMLMPVIFFIVLAVIFYIRFRRSSRMAVRVDMNLDFIALELKSGLSGKVVTTSDLTKIQEAIHKCSDRQSRHYNNFYTRP